MFEHSQLSARAAAGSGPDAPPRFGRPVDPGRLVRTIARGRVPIALAAIVVVGAGVGVPLRMIQPTYASEAQLVWEPGATALDQAPPGPRELRTLVDSVKLPRNLERIRRETHSDVSLRQLGQQLDVRFVADSNLVTIQARAASARSAAQLVQTAVQVFLDHQREIERERVSERSAAIRRDVAASRAELTDAQAAYDTFRRENNLVDLALGPQRAIEEAAQLRAQAELEQERARSTFVSGGGGPTDHALRLAAARTELEQARSHLTSAHPRLQSLQDTVRQIEGESGAVTRTRSAVPSGPVVGVRPGGYRRLAREAEDRLARLTAIEGEASRHLSRVRVAEAHLQELDTSLATADDDVRSATAPFRLVSPPLVPEDPERSYRRVAAIGAPIAGLILLALLVLGLSVWRLRVHTAREAAYWARVPVVGATSWPREPDALGSLLDELGDDAAIARGNTLVVAARPEDARLAEVLASSLQLCRENLNESDPEAQAGDGVLWATVADTRSGVPGPVVTPPPGLDPEDYRVTAPAGTGTALAMPPAAPLAPLTIFPQPGFASWVGTLEETRVRRAARAADRVLVVVRSGSSTIVDLAALRERLGREDGVAVILIDVPRHLTHLPDRVGPHRPFWVRRAGGDGPDAD